ncbi:MULTISPECIES: PLD nuclease N-terminal domain-containing protein [unclassified Arthrobacter]|uniref:PLD nuclease N-terminal domain-containing protein n=1 Tax=unclassified Arthrobacter TaxID=235627 RepID=UPI0014915565|nr:MULTISPECIES: PLD nuclease N-terminal domain-containing protein [unclassified Arthrobacter]MBE0009955.1 PLDc_N domain-containing protein [Arthrobacter sp. AET 35A]NOJ63872.1 PLDc_N domain-containing protein [Arthrobacter sp. 147(2020)]
MDKKLKGKKSRKWSDLSDRQKAMTLVMGSIQLSLAATAWTDLAKRPPEQVNGPKLAWTAIIAINFVGPVLYFVIGRRR